MKHYKSGEYFNWYSLRR